MYPRMWQQSGLSYADLLDELLQLALERPTGLR
jgi:D-alanine-D-alanine ligase